MRDGGVARRAGQASDMEAARTLLVLVLLSGSLGPGQGLEEEGLASKELLAEEPNPYPERLFDWMQQEYEERAAQSPPEEHPLGTLLRSFLHAVQRPGRSPSFLFQPQRMIPRMWNVWDDVAVCSGSLFGRDARASFSSSGRINPRAWDSMAPQFLSMAAPQRFGKKK